MKTSAPRRVDRRWPLAALLIAALAAPGCKNACEQLADFICSCEPNRSEEVSCQQAVNAVSNRPVTPADSEQCEIRLDSCTCDALENDDLVACGLGKAAPDTGG